MAQIEFLLGFVQDNCLSPYLVYLVVQFHEHVFLALLGTTSTGMKRLLPVGSLRNSLSLVVPKRRIAGDISQKFWHTLVGMSLRT